MEHKSKIKPKSGTFTKTALKMDRLVLSPVGYPLKAGDEASPFLSTDDPSLFQHYARSQWIGLVVKKGNFLFDSLIFPDYAFRAIVVKPKESQITKKTQIILHSEQNIDPVNKISQQQTTFSNIIGQEKAKEKCQIVGKFLKNVDLMNSPWAPKNILFWGPPGNGKTMMAKALSNKIKSPMFLIKASDLLGIYVGDGARKIKNLFSEARRSAPAVIFIDELDSIALKRNFQSIRGDVVELVSALLGEMDGIDTNQGIITIGSTNQPKILDSAILSRFEDLIEFKYPTSSERHNILELYANSSPIPFHDISWDLIVQQTANWSGRDLKERIIKSAIHYAVLYHRDSITMKELNDSLQKAKVFDENLTYYS
ncbi:MAG: AAA family ATPase [Candidatus Hodarchaeales archaeon]